MKATLKLLIFCLLFQISGAQENYVPSPENLEARKWFQEARFGMFIHWGVYSLLGDGEWVMNNQNISVQNYEKLSKFFNPIDFDADEWVRIAKSTGMKYITITSRHHDGFSMYDTKASDYNIVKRTPYKKDVLKALAEACKRENIKLFFYYSLLDWRDDNYFPRGRTGLGIKGRKEGDWEKYIAFMKTQLTELLTNYGEIGGIWLDGHWDQKDWDGKKFGKLRIDWHYDELYKLIHDLQPQALIGNNHHIAPISGEDFQMFERDLPGQNTTGWGTDASDIGTLPLEVCETINGSWGFDLQDKNHKSEKDLIHYIVKAAGYGSNLLLNVGPMPNGEIQIEHINLLKKMGDWMHENGETIYKTGAGPFAPTNDIAATRKGNKVYLHFLNAEKERFYIPDFNGKIKSMTYYKSNQKVTYKVSNLGLIVEIPNKQKTPFNTIVEIVLK
jgi:alpha-L-fucosidase